jgi:hypothetical protein
MQDINDFMNGYVPEERPENEGFKPIPEGEYHAKIDSVKMQDKGKGWFADVTFKIVGPTHANRLVWDMCCLTYENPKANQMGKDKLYRLSTACGLTPATATKDDYPGRDVIVVLTIDGDNNRVKTVKPYVAAASAPKPVAKPVSAPSVDGEEEPAW